MGDKEQIKHKLLISLDGVGTTFFIEPKHLPAVQDVLKVLHDNVLFILCDKNWQGITEVEERCNVYWQRTPESPLIPDGVECDLEDGEDCHSKGCTTGDMMTCDKKSEFACDDVENGEDCHSRGCSTGDIMVCDKTPRVDNCDDVENGVSCHEYKDEGGDKPRCTWYYRDSNSSCGNEALHEKYGKDGILHGCWANLCDRHHEELEEAIQSLDGKQIMSAWIKAGGGAKVMMKRTVK